MISFNAVQPVGSRTCCDLKRRAGNIQHEWLDHEVPEYIAEHVKLKNGTLDEGLLKRQHLDALGVLRTLRDEASRGQLPVGKDASFRARVLNRLPYLIELRPKLARGTPPPRLVRLYYAEPLDVDGSLLPLAISTKPNGDDVNDEQNSAIDDAKSRSRAWVLKRMMRS